MILTELRSYLRSRKRAPLIDMANHFAMDPEALRAMLDRWAVKGRVVRLPSGTPCADGCCKRDPATIDIYEWVD